MKKVLFALSMYIMLAGCITRQPAVNILSPTPPVPMPQTDPVVVKPVEWKVYNAEELKKLSDSLVASGGNVVLFTLDSANFKALGDNLTATEGFIKEQNKAIQFLFKAANAPANAAKASAEKK